MGTTQAWRECTNAEGNYILAAANERDFLPEVRLMSREELLEVAGVYCIHVARRNTAKSALVKLISQKIKDRTEYTLVQWERLKGK